MSANAADSRRRVDDAREGCVVCVVVWCGEGAMKVGGSELIAKRRKRDTNRDQNFTEQPTYASRSTLLGIRVRRVYYHRRDAITDSLGVSPWRPRSPKPQLRLPRLSWIRTAVMPPYGRVGWERWCSFRCKQKLIIPRTRHSDKIASRAATRCPRRRGGRRARNRPQRSYPPASSLQSCTVLISTITDGNPSRFTRHSKRYYASARRFDAGRVRMMATTVSGSSLLTARCPLGPRMCR